jgi:SH3-like domain-containing protein
MKKVLFKAIGLVVLVVLISSCSWAGFVSVATRDAYIRVAPDENSNEVANVTKFYPLYVLAQAGAWYRVRGWMGEEGWILAAQVSPSRSLVVKKIKVVLHAGPGTKYRSVAPLFKGYVLKVVDKKGPWYRVMLVDPPDGIEGWVHSSMVWGN